MDANAADMWNCAPIEYAAGSGHLRIANLLLQNGANPAVTDMRGWTPISRAAQEEHGDIVSALLECDKLTAGLADLECRTPLSHAAEEGHETIVQLFAIFRQRKRRP